MQELKSQDGRAIPLPRRIALLRQELLPKVDTLCEWIGSEFSDM